MSNTEPAGGIDCQEVSRLISQGLDEQLPPERRAQLRIHFEACRSCRNVNEQMDFIRRAMRKLGQQEPPP